jgi:hypothetical protein
MGLTYDIIFKISKTSEILPPYAVSLKDLIRRISEFPAANSETYLLII